MDISSLLNTDLRNLNDKSLTLENDRLSMYNIIYIFLKFTCPIYVKTKTYILMKTKAFFQNQRFGKLKEAKRRYSGSSVKIYSNWWSQTPNHDYKLVRNYKLICCFLCRRKWLLRMIPPVWLFANVHRINQQHKLTPCCLYKLEDSGAPLEPYFWLPSHSNLNYFQTKSKNQHLH